MNIFLKRFFVFLCPLIALLALQYVVDPFDNYSWQFIPAHEHNPRRDKVESYLANGKYDYETIVLGTSRAMRLDFGDNAFNFGVFAAKTEDLYCILRFVLDHCTVPPKQIILGIDPELFHNHSSFVPDLVNEPQLSKYFIYNTLGQREYDVDTLQSISSAIALTIIAIKNYITEDVYDTFIEVKPGTGSFVNRSSYCHLEEPSAESIQNVVEVFNNFTALDEFRMLYFEKFLDLCRNNNTKVIGFITPVHPKLDQALRNHGSYPSRLNELYDYFEHFTSNGFEYIDLSVPKLFDGDDYDFFDVLHMGYHNAELIVERLSELIED